MTAASIRAVFREPLPGVRPQARDPDYTAPRPGPVISPVAM